MTARPFRSIASVLIQRTIVLAVLCMVVVFLGAVENQAQRLGGL